jgi:O-antigen/teichoic acid export membrane protein
LFLILASLVVAILTVAALAAVPLGSWLNLEAISGEDLSAVVLLLTAHVLVSFQSGLLYGGYCSEGRYGIGMFLTTTTYLLEFGGLALAVVLGGGPVEAGWGFLSGRVAGFVLLRIFLKGIAPSLHFGWRRAHRKQILRLIQPAVASMAFPLGNALNIQGLRLVVGIALGPVAVTVFATLRTLSRIGFQLVQSVSHIIEPELGLAFGKGDSGLFRQIIRRSCQVAWWGALVACVILWLAGETLLEVWSRGEIAMDWPLYASLLLATVANALWFTALMAAYATNRHGRIALVYAFVYGVGALVLAYVGTQVAGLTGVGVAVVLAEAGMAAYVIPAALHLSNEKWIPWLRTVLQPPWFLVRRLRGQGR